MDLDQRIFVTVFPFGGFFGGGGRTRQKAKTIIQVFVNHKPVIVWV
jgi:hypothetical protein